MLFIPSFSNYFLELSVHCPRNWGRTPGRTGVALVFMEVTGQPCLGCLGSAFPSAPFGNSLVGGEKPVLHLITFCLTCKGLALASAHGPYFPLLPSLPEPGALLLLCLFIPVGRFVRPFPNSGTSSPLFSVSKTPIHLRRSGPHVPFSWNFAWLSHTNHLSSAQQHPESYLWTQSQSRMYVSAIQVRMLRFYEKEKLRRTFYFLSNICTC